MKRIVVIFLIIYIALFLVSCDKNNTEPTSTTEPTKTTIPEPTQTEEPTYRKTVILDPGHGFSDPGTTIAIQKGFSTKSESDINLSVVMKLKPILEARGYRVILTHDGKTFPSCDEIAAKADQYGIYYNEKHPTYWIPNDNRFDAYECGIWAQVLEKENEVDMFMSIHADSSESEKATGTTLYYCVETDAAFETQKLVRSIENSIKSTFTDRKVRSEGNTYNNAYIVTKYPSSPSLLVEVGFCSSPIDMAYMENDEWITNFATSLANGIDSYFGY